MERIRKESDLPKKKWWSSNIQQKYSHTKLTQSSWALYFVEFSTRCARLKMTWHARDQWIACAPEMRSSNWGRTSLNLSMRFKTVRLCIVLKNFICHRDAILWNAVCTYYTGCQLKDFYCKVKKDRHIKELDFSAQSVQWIPRFFQDFKRFKI